MRHINLLLTSRSSSVDIVVQELVTFCFKIRKNLRITYNFSYSKKFVWPFLGYGPMAHSTGCSGAVPQVINMQQQQMNLGPIRPTLTDEY